MNINKQKVTRIKNEISKKKLSKKEERQRRMEKNMYLFSKLRLRDNTIQPAMGIHH